MFNMITSKDIYLMDVSLFQKFSNKENVSSELTELIISMSDYLNLIAERMEELEIENEKLNKCIIEINIPLLSIFFV